MAWIRMLKIVYKWSRDCYHFDSEYTIFWEHSELPFLSLVDCWYIHQESVQQEEMPARKLNIQLQIDITYKIQQDNLKRTKALPTYTHIQLLEIKPPSIVIDGHYCYVT